MTQFNPDYSCGVGPTLDDWIDGNDKTTEQVAESLGVAHVILIDIIINDVIVNDFFIQKVANYTGISAKTLIDLNNRKHTIYEKGVK